MAFREILFPPRISANASGGPRFITSKAYTRSGRRAVNSDALYPIHEYTISHPVRTGDGFNELRAFFYIVGGDKDGFLFKDWTDYVASSLNTSLTLVSGSVYQLNRTYTFGSDTYVRPIYKPAAGAIVFRDRSGAVSTASATVDATTGRATISGHVEGDTYTWSGQFHVPVAFKDPQAVWNFIGTPDMLTEWVGIELEEVRL